MEDVWLDKVEILREDPMLANGTRFDRKKSSKAVEKEERFVKLRLEGRLIDVKNPMSTVSPDSYNRVKALLGQTMLLEANRSIRSVA